MNTRSRIYALVLVSLVTLGGCGDVAATDPVSEAIEIKAVVMAMFERGEPLGDEPGELQRWLEGYEITEELAFPAGESNLYLTDDGVLIFLLGGGIPNATASVMALGYDERVDVSKAYWLIAGIAGGDPDDLSLGSAAWARHVVDGDLLYEIDGREIPEDWPYGLIPLGAKEPTQNPEDIYGTWTLDTVHFELDRNLVDWAYQLTKDIELPDAPGISEFRQLYPEGTAARRAPFVTIGDTLSASTYWHGELLNTWANDWLRLYAGADANFMTSNMEDSGTLTAIHRLDRIARADADRVLVLRTASNFTMPPPDKSAAWSKSAPYPDNGIPSIDTAYTVGRVVLDAIVDDWDQYRDTLPTATSGNGE
ncbi:MAG: purine nucleoside permease [Pseudomonadota bacterium]